MVLFPHSKYKITTISTMSTKGEDYGVILLLYKRSMLWALLGYVNRAHADIYSATEIYQTFELSSRWPLQNDILGFLKFWKLKFYQFTWDPMRVKISNCYSSCKCEPNVFNLFLNFPLNGSQKVTFGIFEILSFQLLTTFIAKISDSPWFHMGEPKKKNPQLSGKRPMVERNGVKFGTRKQ